MPSDSSHLNNEEIKLEILRIVVEAGTLNQKENPLPICENYYKWIKDICRAPAGALQISFGGEPF